MLFFITHLVAAILIWIVLLAGLIVTIYTSICSDLTIRFNQLVLFAAVGDTLIGAVLMKIFIDLPIM